MSTTFAILKKERDAFGDVIKLKRYDIAHRHGIGGGKVGITWLSINVLDAINIFNGCTDKTEIKVHPMDNTAQGVDNIGDLITLDKHGTLKKVKKKPAVKAVKYNMLDNYKKLNKEINNEK